VAQSPAVTAVPQTDQTAVNPAAPSQAEQKTEAAPASTACFSAAKSSKDGKHRAPAGRRRWYDGSARNAYCFECAGEGQERQKTCGTAKEAAVQNHASGAVKQNNQRSAS